MPRYHVHFTADPADPVPPPAELPSVEADDPVEAVEAMLAAGRYPQDPSVRWARVVVGLHLDGSPRSLLRVAVHAERTNVAIDWNVGGFRLTDVHGAVIRQIVD